MKKLINNPEHVVDEMLNGIVKAHPEYVKRLPGLEVLVRAKKGDKVALVSGGGSGHEPSHGGLVGTGMLDGAVAGAVFTSPTPDQVFEAIKAVDAGKGVLLVIKNYTGDVMNFEMAAEMAEMEGITVDKVVVNDDVAVKDSLWTVGRRGVAGTVLVHKIAGAYAEAGADLAEVKRIAEKVIANVRTMGMAIAPCTVPAAGKPGFELKEDEMEMGIGIHGEPGTYRAPLKAANEIADEMLEKILADRAFKEVAVLVKLGGTPHGALRRQQPCERRADGKGVKVYKTIVGNLMTSIEMQGCSITLLELDDDLKKGLDAKADTIAFRC